MIDTGEQLHTGNEVEGSFSNAELAQTKEPLDHIEEMIDKSLTVTLPRRTVLKGLGLVLTTLAAACNGIDVRPTPPSSDLETPTARSIPPTESEAQEELSKEELKFQLRDKIEKAIPSEEFVSEASDQIITVLDSLKNKQMGEGSEIDFMYTDESGKQQPVILSVRNGFGAGFHRSLITQMDRREIEGHNENTYLQILRNPSFDWDLMTNEEKELAVLHEVHHVAQLVELDQSLPRLQDVLLKEAEQALADSEEKPSKEQIEELVYKMASVQLTLPNDPRGYEAVPYISNLLAYTQLSEEQKTNVDFYDVTQYHDQFMDLFGNQISSETTVQALVESPQYDEFKAVVGGTIE